MGKRIVANYWHITWVSTTRWKHQLRKTIWMTMTTRQKQRPHNSSLWLHISWRAANWWRPMKSTMNYFNMWLCTFTPKIRRKAAFWYSCRATKILWRKKTWSRIDFKRPTINCLCCTAASMAPAAPNSHAYLTPCREAFAKLFFQQTSPKLLWRSTMW